MPLPTRPIAETNSTWRCDHRADTENDPALRTLWQSIRSPLFHPRRRGRSPDDGKTATRRCALCSRRRCLQPRATSIPSPANSKIKVAV